MRPSDADAGRAAAGRGSFSELLPLALSIWEVLSLFTIIVRARGRGGLSALLSSTVISGVGLLLIIDGDPLSRVEVLVQVGLLTVGDDECLTSQEGLDGSGEVLLFTMGGDELLPWEGVRATLVASVLPYTVGDDVLTLVDGLPVAAAGEPSSAVGASSDGAGGGGDSAGCTR